MSEQFSDEQLLSMAMGITDKASDPDEAEFVEIAILKGEWEVVPKKRGDIWTKRKKMRHNMFKIIKRMKRELELTPDLLAIKSIIDPQLDPNRQMNWATFTFYWDVSPADHTKVITKDKFFAEGGDVDELGGFRPPAFTEQEIS